jgi:uncharacterized protein (DUF58 family)
MNSIYYSILLIFYVLLLFYLILFFNEFYLTFYFIIVFSIILNIFYLFQKPKIDFFFNIMLRQEKGHKN